MLSNPNHFLSKAEISKRLEQAHVHVLVKFLPCSDNLSQPYEFAEHFMETGEVFMRALGSFVNFEDQGKETSGDRKDIHEGQVASFMRANQNLAIYCMTALMDDDVKGFLTSQDGKHILQEFLHCNGAICVVTDPAKFLQRLQATELREDPENGAIWFEKVLYEGDYFTHEALLKDFDGCCATSAYLKAPRFGYQHEFRIVTNHKCQEITHIETLDGQECEVMDDYQTHIVHLGNLDDIAKMIIVKPETQESALSC